MEETETGSQLSQNPLSLQWKVKGKKQNVSSQNGVEA